MDLTDTQTQLQRLAHERAALRRVADLVARGASAEEVLDAVAGEASRLVGVAFTTLLRYEADGATEIVAVRGPPSGIVVGMRASGDGEGAVQTVFRTRRAARMDDLSQASGHWPQVAHRLGFTSSAAAPVMVAGRLWGTLVVTGTDGPLSAALEQQLTVFAEIAGTAVSAAQARSELARLADEHAALRRVAELTAHQSAPPEVFDAIVTEASRLMDDAAIVLAAVEGGAVHVVAVCGSAIPVGRRLAISDEATPLLAALLRTGRPQRNDHLGRTPAGAESVAGLDIDAVVVVPIVVAGAPWGCLSLHTSGRAPGPATETRLTEFARLAAAAISGAQALDDLRALVDEQAALRRVAELTARGGSPAEVFAAVTLEASHLVDDEPMTLTRFEGQAELVVVATRSGPAPVGERIAFTPEMLPGRILRTGRAQRVDDYAQAPDAALARRFGMTASVAAPILVQGRVWGMLTATSPARALPPGTEDRLAQFAELVAAAIANAEGHAELTASRARVVATADETRRRLQRDVHDGAQQRLVQTVVTLELARDALGDPESPAGRLIDAALTHARRATDDLRQVIRGVLPASLERSGLAPAVRSLAAGLPLPVQVDATHVRLARETEMTAYFIVAEALTNVVKHAQASHASVGIALDPGTGELRLVVSDDGIGGADPRAGTGLTGLSDRVAAADGVLAISSHPGGGTTLDVRLPARAPQAAPPRG